MHVAHLRCRYRALGPRSAAESIASRLDGVREELPPVIESALDQALGNDPGVYVLRRVRNRVSLRVAADRPDSELAETWGRSLVAAILRALHDAAEDAAEVMRFADQGEYVARFLADLVAGRAWERWYYRPFAVYQSSRPEGGDSPRFRRPWADTEVRPYGGGDGGCSENDVLSRVLLGNRDHLAGILARLERQGTLDGILGRVDETALRELWSEEPDRLEAPGREELRALVTMAFSLVDRLGRWAGDRPRLDDFLALYRDTRPEAADWRDRGSLAAAMIDVLRFAVAEGRLRHGAPEADFDQRLDQALAELDWLDLGRLRRGLVEALATTVPADDVPADDVPVDDVPVEDATPRPARGRGPTPRQKDLLADLGRILDAGKLRLDLHRRHSPANALRLYARLVERYPRWADDSGARALIERLLQAWHALAGLPRAAALLRRLGEAEAVSLPPELPAMVARDLRFFAGLGAVALRILEALVGPEGRSDDGGDVGSGEGHGFGETDDRRFPDDRSRFPDDRSRDDRTGMNAPCYSTAPAEAGLEVTGEGAVVAAVERLLSILAWVVRAESPAELSGAFERGSPAAVLRQLPEEISRQAAGPLTPRSPLPARPIPHPGEGTPPPAPESRQGQTNRGESNCRERRQRCVAAPSVPPTGSHPIPQKSPETSLPLSRAGGGPVWERGLGGEGSGGGPGKRVREGESAGRGFPATPPGIVAALLVDAPQSPSQLPELLTDLGLLLRRGELRLDLRHLASPSNVEQLAQALAQEHARWRDLAAGALAQMVERGLASCARLLELGPEAPAREQPATPVVVAESAREGIETGCAGVFLLLRAILDAHLPAIVDKATYPPGAEPSPLGAVLTALGWCWGGESAVVDGGLDPGLALLAGWTTAPALEEIRGSWRQATAEDHLHLQAALLRVLAGQRLVRGSVLHLHQVARGDRVALVAGTDGGGLWPLGRVFASREALESGLGDLLTRWLEIWRETLGRAPEIVLCEAEAVEEYRCDRQALEKALTALDHCRLEAPDAELTAALTGISLLRIWAHWLRQFSGSSAAYLLDSFIRRSGRLRADDDVLVVELEPGPIDMVIEMAGYLGELDRLSFLDDRRVEFRIRSKQ